MGMYTEIFFRGTLRKDVPDDVVAAIGAIIAGHDSNLTLPEHPLFQCHRWEVLGGGSSAYFPDHPRSQIVGTEYGDQLGVVISGNLKNYDSEIEKFFDWIDPYVDAEPGEFLGYSLYEDVEPETAPTPYFKKENN